MFKVIAENGNSRTVETRSQAEEIAEDMERLGMSVEINQVKETDGGKAETHTVSAEKLSEETGEPKETFEADDKEIPEVDELESAGGLDELSNKDITTDPLSVMPGHFVDTIQGVPTINRKGYAVLAEHFGVSVKAEPVTLPSETDFEYAEFRAVATTEEGAEYSGFGSAHIDRMDGDDPHLLAELAETRAMKRACAWATGVGITAYTEMTNSL